jgi:hypothetical protein
MFHEIGYQFRYLQDFSWTRLDLMKDMSTNERSSRANKKTEDETPLRT